MRAPWILFLPLALGCGGSSGDVISSLDAGSPLFPPQPPDCASGPNYTGCACQVGATTPCYTGPAATRDVFGCKDGTQTCTLQGGENAGAAFGACEGETVPTAANPCTGPLSSDAGDECDVNEGIALWCCVVDPTDSCTLSSTLASGGPCTGWTCPSGEPAAALGSCLPPCNDNALDGGACQTAANCAPNQVCVQDWSIPTNSVISSQCVNNPCGLQPLSCTCVPGAFSAYQDCGFSCEVEDGGVISCSGGG
jgi:hypothetical protein